jgi:hypothetical protein
MEGIINMGKRILIIVGVCIVVIAFFVVKLDVFSWVFYPTKSSPHKLSIVLYSGFFPNKPVITLKHYKNGLHVGDYSLEIEDGVYDQEPQSYELPKLDNGTVMVNVELGDEMSSSFILTYDDAETLYQKGLLIYLANFDTPYVYFVSGKETTCYNKATDSDKFTIETEFPSLKTIPANENPGFVAIYSGWKENKWVVNDSSSEPS